MENKGKLTVAFKDDSNDNTFICEVNYAYVPRSVFSDLGERSGRAKGGQRVPQPITAGTAVVRGFHFKFRNGDHHIRDIGVWIPGDGRLEVYYEDYNGDDEFDYSVQWAVIPNKLAVYTKPSARRPK